MLYFIYLFNKTGKNNMSKISAIIADKMVIWANWLIDLNSENNNGINDTIIIIVVLIIALKVFSWQYIRAFLTDLLVFLFILYADIICIESSTIKPKTIAKINAFERLR